MADSNDALAEAVPPYTLEPFLFPTLLDEDVSDATNPDSPAAIQRNLQRSLRCAEADQSHLYIGSSDGYVHSFEISTASQSTSLATSRHRLVHSRLISNKSKPVEKIVLLRAFRAAAVICEGVLSFYTLPEWNPVRSLPTTRAVSTVVLDDEEADQADGTDGAGMVSLCIVRRKNVVLVKIGAETQDKLLWAVVKDIPLPGGAIFARRFADTLCIANATEYSLMNLSSGSVTQLHLPISQTGESPSAQVKPSIVSVPVVEIAARDGSVSPTVARSDSAAPPSQTKCEFLITSHTGTITLGVFVKPSGEPVAKLLEWPSHPRSVCFDGKYLVSLLRNDTIEIHRIQGDAVERVQVQHIPPGLESRFLQVVATSKPVSTNTEAESPSDSPLDLLKVRLDNLSSTPQVLKRSPQIASSDAQVVLCGRNSTAFVCQQDLLEWANDHLDNGRISLLQEQLEQHRNQGFSSAFDVTGSPSPTHATYASLIVELLHRTRFSDVKALLEYAMLDPRFLLAFFPDLNGSQRNDSNSKPAAVLLSLTAQRLRVLQSRTGALKSIEDLISDNFAVNYSLSLDAESDATLQQLRHQLQAKATAMLRSCIELWRAGSLIKKQTGQGPPHWPGRWMDEKMIGNVDVRVDTCYLDLLLMLKEQRGDDSVDEDIQTLLSSPHACDADVVEGALKKRQYLALLSQHYEQRGQTEQALELWTGLLDASLTDKFGSDVNSFVSVDKIVGLLEQQEDSHLLSKYGTWLVRKDPQAGIRILTRRTVPTAVTKPGDVTRNTATRAQELEAIKGHKDTLRELQGIDPDAATIYLETVALTTSKVQDEQMHRDLARILLKRVQDHLQDDAYRNKMQSVSKDYSSGLYAESFFAHLALAATTSSRDLDRLKLAMLLQGSTVLDYSELLSEVESHETLAFERAIILGKLGKDRDALALLAVSLRDANSAEAYCSQDGEVLSPMLALSVAQDHPVLLPFASMLAQTHAQRVKAHYKATGEHNLSDQERKEDLLKQLLSVYMENGAEQQFRIATAHLLNTQALHLDGLQVLDLVPKDWPIKTLETFLTQNLRRQLHRKREAQIVRNISLCRNLDVAEDLWARQRAMGGLLQDTEDEFVGPNRGENGDDEGDSLNFDQHEEKKVSLRPPSKPAVHDIQLDKDEADSQTHHDTRTTRTQ